MPTSLRFLSGSTILFTFLFSFFLLTPTAHANPPSTVNLSAYYSFDNASSLGADSSGNNINATNNGATAITGQVNGGASFNGTSNFIGQSNATSGLTNIGANGIVTLSAWVKPNSTSFGIVFLKGQAGMCFNYGIALYNGKLSGANSSNFYALSGALTTNTWQHVAIVYNGASMTGYVNGVQTGTVAAGSSNCASNGWAIGTRGFNDPGWYYSGVVDEVRVYNRALTAQEVLDIYNDNGTPTVPTISAFSANPSTIGSGSSSTLSWATNGANSLSIDNGVGNVTGQTSVSVSPATTTTYTLTATNAVGSVTSTTTVTVMVPDTTAPSVPTNLVATDVSSSQINLSWSFSTDNVAVTGYKIYRGGIQVGTSATNSYSDTGLSASTNYSYTVSAYDAVGNVSAQSSLANATTTTSDVTPPVISSVSSSNISSSGATLTWTTDENSDSQVKYGLTNSYGQLSNLNSSLTSLHSITLSGLSPATIYHYRVDSRDGAGNLATSSDATFITTSSGNVVLQAGPGQTVSLSADLNLTGSQSISLVGNAGSPCTLNGNGHSITTNAQGGWTGTFTIQYCNISNVGTASTRAFNIVAGNGTNTVIENNTWNVSSNIYVNAFGNANIFFRYNLVPENELYPVAHNDPGFGGTQPFFYATGNSTGSRIIAGNRIYKSYINLVSSPGWVIGVASPTACSSAPQDSNIIVGLRGSVAISSNTTVRCNYIHAEQHVFPQDPNTTDDEANWSQVSLLTANDATGSLVEYNVLDQANWIIRGINAEVRYNIISAGQHDYMDFGKPDANIHHNIFTGLIPFAGTYDVPSAYPGSPQTMLTMGSSIAGSVQVHDNTFDLSDPSISYLAEYGYMWIGDNVLMPTIKNNAFSGISIMSGHAAFDQGVTVTTPYPDRLTYADYNAFAYKASSPSKNNYDVNVAGKSICTDGFGLHDVGGCSSSSLNDLQFRGPIPHYFPFAYSDIKSGIVSVQNILDYYNSVYAPASSSPLLSHSDVGGDVGAVQTASAPAAHTTNFAPIAVAGPDLTVTTSNTAFLNSWGADDCLPVRTNCATTLSWSLVSGPGTASFTPAPGGGGTYYRVTFSNPGTYVVRLTVSDGSLVGTDDAIININTTPDTTAPSTPANLTAISTSSSQINISWTTSSDNVAVTGYQVFRNGIQIATSTVTNYSNTGLASSTTYSYTVTAYDAAGNVSAQSSSASATTQNPPLPSAPVINNFTASPASITTGGSSTLSWSVSNVTFLSIDNGIGNVTNATSTVVSPATTTVYTLTASNSIGTTTAQTTVTINTNGPPTNGLSAYYSFDNPSSLGADSSGNNINATNNGATAATGQVNGGASLNGTSNFIGQSNAASGLTNIGANGAVTLSAWIKPNNTSGLQVLFMKGSAGVCFNYGMAIYNGKLNSANSSNFYPISSSLTAGAWQHVAIVYTGTTTIGYVNGVQTGTTTAGSSNCGNNGWSIGDRGTDPGWYYGGLVDEFRVYNRALSAAEVQSLMH